MDTRLKRPPKGTCDRCGARIPKSDYQCRPCRRWEESEEGKRVRKEEREREKASPGFSICSANGKWFWLAMPKRGEYWKTAFENGTIGLPTWATGYAETYELAEAAARAIYPAAMLVKPRYASLYHRQLAARRHFNRMKAKASHVREGVMVDYLWFDDHGWEKARIIRKTAKRIFVWKPEYLYGLDGGKIFNPVEYEEHPEWFHTAALDREKLESKGWAWGGGRHGERYYTDEGMRNEEVRRMQWRSPTAPIPIFLVALGLAPGCTEKDVRRAYRRKSREAHPDGGGSHEAFIKLTDHYDMALRYAQCRQAAAA